MRLPTHLQTNDPSTRCTLLDIDALVNGIRAGQRIALARGITLVESTRADHHNASQHLLQALLDDTGKAIRLGISGVPGVGKSTFIEALGMHLLERGYKVAVLAIDPSSERSGGSILGDKTRMAKLSMQAAAYIRPSPTGGHLGGVTRVTRESLLLCEAAGFDVVLIETVGVGQSETQVSAMVDCFLVLMLPAAGDELQGIKKGVLELADIIAVNKADGDLQQAARQAAAAYTRALSILQPVGSWKPRVQTCSAVSGIGLEELWQLVLAHRQQSTDNGELAKKREQQQVQWLWSMVEQKVLANLRQSTGMSTLIESLERAVREGRQTVPQACEQLLQTWQSNLSV